MISAADIASSGYSARDLWELEKAGTLDRVRRGRYRRPDAKLSPQDDLLEVASRIPNGVFCLVTALYLHEMGTQSPPKIWVAIPKGARSPHIEDISLVTIERTKKNLAKGIEVRKIGRKRIRITTPAQTVVDCFKFRNRVGQDVAIEALKGGFENRKFTSDELYHIAVENHAWNTIRPYAEAIG